MSSQHDFHLGIHIPSEWMIREDFFSTPHFSAEKDKREGRSLT
jgi:hypothetical protein